MKKELECINKIPIDENVLNMTTIYGHIMTINFNPQLTMNRDSKWLKKVH